MRMVSYLQSNAMGRKRNTTNDEPAEPKPKLLSREEEHDLAVIYKESKDPAKRQAAMDKLVAANMGMVSQAALKYSGMGMEYADLRQEGVIGLILAINKFNPYSGNKLGTYAYYWINQSVARALMKKGRTVHIPENNMRIINNMRKYMTEVESRENRTPDAEEIAEHLNQDVEWIRFLLVAMQDTTSLNTPVSDNDGGEGGEFGDLLPDADAASPDDEAEAQYSDEKVREILDSIDDPKARDIVIKRLGLNGQEVSIKDICKEYNLTQKEFKDLMNDAMTKLRTDENRIKLNDFPAVNFDLIGTDISEDNYHDEYLDNSDE